MYEDDLLPLSGIQHFAFCERQWGLIHIENQWVENVRTAQGRLLHQRVDDPYLDETRAGVKTVRSLPLVSKTLGMFGVADVLEIERISPDQMRHSIVEYKRGRPKPDDRDEVQLCAQAICLEEMTGINLDHGYLFYGDTKHRHKVMLDKQLRARVYGLAERMHELYSRGETPPALKTAKCRGCSMIDICLPGLKVGVGTYLDRLFDEMRKDAEGAEL